MSLWTVALIIEALRDGYDEGHHEDEADDGPPINPPVEVVVGGEEVLSSALLVDDLFLDLLNLIRQLSDSQLQIRQSVSSLDLFVVVGALTWSDVQVDHLQYDTNVETVCYWNI